MVDATEERAQQRGISLGCDHVKQMFKDFANDGRSGFKNGLRVDRERKGRQNCFTNGWAQF